MQSDDTTIIECPACEGTGRNPEGECVSGRAGCGLGGGGEVEHHDDCTRFCSACDGTGELTGGHETQELPAVPTQDLADEAFARIAERNRIEAAALATAMRCAS